MNSKTFLPYQQKQKRYLHVFGCTYSQTTTKQIYFNEKSAKQTIDTQQILLNYEEQNKRLKTQLSEVYNIVTMILYSDNKHQHIYQKTMTQLLQEVLNIIISKTQENVLLKQKIEELAFKASQNLSFSQSKQIISEQPSRINSNSQLVLNNPKHQQEFNILQNSQKVSINRPKYEPKILFTIGKQVKTISQISSGRILKKQSFNSHSKSSSQQNSYKQLLNATKKNRLSIDKSIYLDQKDIQNIRSSVQNINKISSIEANHHQPKENIGIISRQLTPIKEERFSSDQYSQINSSKIQNGSFNVERFTFQSSNTDPQSYTKNY